MKRFGQISHLLQAGFGALRDPTRQDLVAAVGEISATFPSSFTLERMRDRMLVCPIGRSILRDRLLINSSTIDIKSLSTYPTDTLGFAYHRFLDTENVSPDTRSPVKYIQNHSNISTTRQEGALSDDDSTLDCGSELEYVMLRYRQIHDFIHVLTGVPTSLTGELALKWFEYANTGLPMALLAGIFGPVRLLPIFKYQDILQGSSGYDKYSSRWDDGNVIRSARMSDDVGTFYEEYLPWAVQAGSRSEFLLNVRYEDCLKMKLDQLRSQLKVIPIPSATSTNVK